MKKKSTELPAKVLWMGFARAWIACIISMGLTGAVMAVMPESSTTYEDFFEALLLCVVSVAIFSFPLIFGVGYILFKWFEKKGWRSKGAYLIGGALVSSLIPLWPIGSLFGILVTYVFWKSVTEKYLIKK